MLHSIRVLSLATLASAALYATSSWAQPMPASMPAQGMAAMDNAMKSMDSDMMTGMHAADPDQRYAAMMIPHHQGAIDMSRMMAGDIKDPVLRKIVQQTMRENEKGVAALKDWQRKHPSP